MFFINTGRDQALFNLILFLILINHIPYGITSYLLSMLKILLFTPILAISLMFLTSSKLAADLKEVMT